MIAQITETLKTAQEISAQGDRVLFIFFALLLVGFLVWQLRYTMGKYESAQLRYEGMAENHARTIADLVEKSNKVQTEVSIHMSRTAQVLDQVTHILSENPKKGKL